MARTPTPPRAKSVAALTHDEATRLNNPTAEMASLYEQQAEMLGEKPVEMRLKRDRPLAAGETRDRDVDRDPQIVWSNAKVRLTQAQLRALAAGEEVDLSEAQLTWRGKDAQDWSDLVVGAPPLYIQEKVHPKAIIDDLKRRTDKGRDDGAPDLFADFNGLDDPEAQTEFYQHSKHWQNRMILGDSLQVMASLAEREALRGKVQCIYFDPPYGIKFNSNWQVSTLSRDVKDGKVTDVSREPEQVKAFRDTWKDGIHSYLTYLRDRLSVARELLTESGSIFVQIGDENVHRVRALMDEVFGEENSVCIIPYATTGGTTGDFIPSTFNYVLYYVKSRSHGKYRQLYLKKSYGGDGASAYNRFELPDGERLNISDVRKRGLDETDKTKGRIFRVDNLKSQSGGRAKGDGAACWTRVSFEGTKFDPGQKATWKTHEGGIERLLRARRVESSANNLYYVRYIQDFPAFPLSNQWTDTTTAGFASNKTYVVETSVKIIERCILMATDPGDLVLDPTCGSGTTATVAEQWGRRWITIDTSRVALALARTRLMAARYPYYVLADSAEGRAKEQVLSGKIQPQGKTLGDLRQGFVYDRAPHITLKSIANNAEIDVIWEKWQAVLEPLRALLNAAFGRAVLGSTADGTASTSPLEGGMPGKAEGGVSPAGGGIPPSVLPTISPSRGEIGASPSMPQGEKNGVAAWEEWQIPRDLDTWLDTKDGKPFAGLANPAARRLHAEWWEGRIARQREIDASIAKAADVELLYDRPHEDKAKVRVAGPFTVESLSPHRVVTSRDDTLGDEIAALDGQLQPPSMQKGPANVPEADFGAMVLENLRSSGVHQQAKADTIRFSSLEPWPGQWIAAVGTYSDGAAAEKRAGILIGPEFGTLSRSQITAAAREASDARFDSLVACAFNFDAQVSDLTRLGPLAILKARMNPDLHMAEDLKNTGKGNLFVVFGEPDIELSDTKDGLIQVKVHGVDVFDPSTGDIRSDGTDGIAVWFIDTDYDEQSFFVRHAYFLGAAASGGSDPYKSLKTALKAEIDADAWATLYSDVSRPFPRPSTGRIAVKVINHFGDEVLKVFGV